MDGFIIIMNKFVGEFNFSKQFEIFYSVNQSVQHFNKNEIDFFNNLFSEEQLTIINNEIESINWIPVGIDGYLHNFNGIIGSYRASVYDEKFSHYIFNIIQSFLDKKIILNEFSTTDWDFHDQWNLVSVSPLFRFIKYQHNGILVPHYDASFVYNENKRTLKSFVIYLTTNKTGSTRFLHDQQTKIPYKDRIFEDQFFTPTNNDIIFENSCKKGDAILFNHRLLHDSSIIFNEEKIIIRTDLVYEKI